MSLGNLPRKAIQRFFLGAAIAVASLGFVGHAAAQSMVSVKGKILNMRSGPGTKYEVQWQLHQGYPLQIVQRKGSWLKVKDFEGDTGWVSKRLTSRSPHHVVKVSKANMRSGPGTKYRIVASTEYGELVRTIKRQGNWVQVRKANNRKGWISKKLLWGY